MAIIGAVVLLVTGCTNDAEVDTPEDPAGDDTTDEDALDGDGADGIASEADLADLPLTTIESPMLDGRTLTMTAPGEVVEPEPSSMALRFGADTFGLTVELIEDSPADILGDHEVELVEDRWDGEIRLVTTPEVGPFARYDSSGTSLLIVADQGPPSFEPVTSTEEVMDALDRIDLEQTEDGTVVTTTDPDLEHELLLVYPVDGIESGLSIVDGDELFAQTPIEPVEGPMTGAGGEVVVGEDGYIELSSDDLLARIQLVLPGADEQQRGLDLMTLLELELDD